MTLDTQYDFMKCQVSFDESYKSVKADHQHCL